MTATTANCPRCNGPVYFGMKACPYCGAEILFEEKKGKFVIREGDKNPPTIVVRDVHYKDGVTEVDAVEFKPIAGTHLSRAEEVQYISIDLGPDLFKPKPPPGPNKDARDLLILTIVLAALYIIVMTWLRSLAGI